MHGAIGQNLCNGKLNLDTERGYKHQNSSLIVAGRPVNPSASDYGYKAATDQEDK